MRGGFRSRLNVHPRDRRRGRNFARKATGMRGGFRSRLNVHPRDRRRGRDFARETSVRRGVVRGRCGVHPRDRRRGGDRSGKWTMLGRSLTHPRNRRRRGNCARKNRRGRRTRGNIGPTVRKWAAGRIIRNGAFTFGAKFHLPASKNEKEFACFGWESVFKKTVFLFQHLS